MANFHKEKLKFINLIKRHCNRIRLFLKRQMHDFFKGKSNCNALTNRKTRDEKLEILKRIFESSRWIIFDEVINKFSFKYKKIEFIFFKENENFTEIFLVCKIFLSKNDFITTGIAIEIISRSIFVSLMKNLDLDEILADKKRPKRFHHDKTYKY